MAGAPTKYKSEYNEQVRKLALLGATDIEFADFFNVCEATINNWKIDYPEFLESIKKGKAQADAEVASKLYQRATGYDHEDKHYPADTTAQIFWLKNRQKDKWRDKHEVQSQTLDKDGNPTDPAGTLTPDQIREIAKQLNDKY